jgi:hypothetical protein
MTRSVRTHTSVTMMSFACGLTFALGFGRVGHATDVASPLIVTGGITPVVSLVQDTSSGFPAYHWDFFGDEVGFGIENFTRIAVPFYIEAAAPEDSFVIKANGSVGLGTSTPNNIGSVTGTGRYFNVRATGDSASTGVCNGVFQGTLGAQNHFVHLNAPANQRIMRVQTSSGFTGFHVVNDTLTTYAIANVLSMKMSNGNVGLRVQNPSHPLHLASGAHCTTGGVWTNASSRELKQDIEPITSEQARETVQALQPVGYRYKSEPGESYCGFIAEDVPELVATNDRQGLGAMDVVAVLTKVVQDQQAEMRNQSALLKQQQTLLDEQRQALQIQQDLLARLAQRVGQVERLEADVASK